MGCHTSHWLSYFPRWLSHHQPVHLGNQRFMLHGTSLLIVLFTGVSYCRNHCDFVWWVSSNWSQKNYHETNICRIFAHQSQLIGHIKSYTCNYASAATCSNDIEAGLLFMGDFSRSLWVRFSVWQFSNSRRHSNLQSCLERHRLWWDLVLACPLDVARVWAVKHVSAAKCR